MLVAIVGRPNVGKSTLFNRLAGSRTAIVDDQPGVTRDRNYARVEIRGRSVMIVDTGGILGEEEPGIMAGVRRQALAAIDEADLTVFLADGKDGLHPVDRELADLLRRSGRPFLLVVNKIDGVEKEDLLHDFYELGIEPILPLSAAHGYGIRDFLDILGDRLLEEAPEPESEDRIRLAVIGRPNVGKSSLVNRLAGAERSLVDDVPGTTRDPVDVTVEHRGRTFVLVDTAGIRRKGRVAHGVERLSVMRALSNLEDCDVALMLIDSSEGITEQDAHVAGYAVDRGRAVVLLFNKWDLIKRPEEGRKLIADGMDLKMRFLDFAPRLNISALTGQSVQRIFPAVSRVFTQYTTKVGTGPLNRAIQDAVAAHTPPYAGRGRIKFFYATQTGIRPPSFVAFSNRSDQIHFSYHRYLVNRIRSTFGLTEIPIRLHFKPRNG